MNTVMGMVSFNTTMGQTTKMSQWKNDRNVSAKKKSAGWI